MARITQAKRAQPAGLQCDVCAHRETDTVGGIEAIMKRGSWAQAITSADKHVCQRCYRELEPLAREGYWRRPLRPARVVARRSRRPQGHT
jgi:hypothetical protein